MKQLLNYFLLVMCFVSTFLLVVFSTTIVSAENTYPFKGMISSGTLVVHNKANTSSSSAVTEIAYGTIVDVLGLENNTYKIIYDGNKNGYVSKNFVINLETNTLTESVPGIETYVDYCNTLVSKGFDNSYCPYLYYLHSKYPKWTFTADKVGVTLETAAKEEEGTGTLPTDNENYWYNSKPIEGGWYYVNSTVIASVMDPRNSLFEDRIFQFLDIVESKDLYTDASLGNISGATGNLYKFIPQYKEVSVINGINPMHLMARSRQEGLNKANYSGTTGTYTSSSTSKLTSHQGYSLDGYYNFYNINSYQTSSYPYTVQRGLAYAAGFLADDSCLTVTGVDSNNIPVAVYDETKCGKLSYMRPWNTPEQAVVGGADFLNVKYIIKGQDNLYYQKFNISSYATNNRYTNQYMTNLEAPVSEGKIIYNAYKSSGMLDSTFNFVIPVFDNMPETVYQPVNKSSNNRLSSITINDKAFNEFDADVVEYNYNLVTNEDTFKVGAKTEDELATLVGTGDYTFTDGIAQVKLMVTAEDGVTNTYVINVKKVIPEEIVTVNDITSKMGVKVNDNIIYGVSPDTAISTLVNTVTKNRGEAKVTNYEGKVKASGSFATGDKIIIKGTSESKTFTIAVRGDVNGDGLIDLKDFVLVQSHILEKRTLSDIYTYAGDVNYDGKIVLADFVLIQSHILNKKSL